VEKNQDLYRITKKENEGQSIYTGRNSQAAREGRPEGTNCLLLMSSSGMRVGALSLLKIRNLEKIDKYSLYKITVYENEYEEYVTFCTPECAKAIDC
jgi:hypothetical protein